MQEFVWLIVEKDAFVMAVLWLITEFYDKSQKRPKLKTKKCQEIPYSLILKV